MIKGIGIDVVELHRFKTMQDRTEFCAQVLSTKEISELPDESASELATRFAIKEAVLKALGCGLTGGWYWHDIELSPMFDVTLRGPLFEIAHSRSISVIHVTHSHSKHFVTACVLLEEEEKEIS